MPSVTDAQWVEPDVVEVIINSAFSLVVQTLNVGSECDIRCSYLKIKEDD